MEFIEKKYIELCDKESDINEHLPTLYNYASRCESILELGIRDCISSWAFVYGLLNNNKPKKKIFLNDILPCKIDDLLEKTEDLNIDIQYQWINDLELDINEKYDMTFIDTWHIYGQLKRELAKFSKITNKYIIMHDTTIDGEFSECCRSKYIAFDSEYTRQELTLGLWYAISEFLENNKDGWVLHKRFTNNCGLTILEKK